jgi:hypothetical protein
MPSEEPERAAAQPNLLTDNPVKPASRRTRREPREPRPPRSDREPRPVSGHVDASGGWTTAAAVTLLLLSVALIAIIDVGIGRGAPVLGHSWDVWALLSAAAGAAVVVFLGRVMFARYGWKVPPRVRTSTVAIGVLLVVAFTLGAANSLVIDGKVMSKTSAAAKSYDLVLRMQADLDTLAAVDELIVLDDAEAQARLKEFERAQADVQEISDRWSVVDITNLPAGEFVPAVSALTAAGNTAAQAVEIRTQLLSTRDAKLAADLDILRSQYVAAALSVGPTISDVEAQFGFSVGPTADGPVE